MPGTQQAAEAVLLAQIPQTARVNRKEVKAPDVVYQGAPKFEPVPTTKVEYAVNTDKDIIRFGDLYYMCFQGVWFMSKKPDGPWEVCSKVPKEIYAIPASSPAHSVTYVTVVEDNSNDDWATFAVVACSGPNSVLDEVSLPVRNTPSMPNMPRMAAIKKSPC